MGVRITTKDYVEYLKKAHEKIHENGDYVTELDLATGDGDHWSNINMGFEKIVEAAPELENMNLFDAFKKLGMIMMSVVGGSGGVLYGSAYLEAAKVIKNKKVLDSRGVCEILDAMLGGIMERGKSCPGDKTMIDTLYPAVQCFEKCLVDNISEEETFEKVKQAALAGAESTRNMEAVRGRAYYQANKGVGHLDPGAVTMAYQIEALMDFMKGKIG